MIKKLPQDPKKKRRYQKTIISEQKAEIKLLKQKIKELENIIKHLENPRKRGIIKVVKKNETIEEFRERMKKRFHPEKK